MAKKIKSLFFKQDGAHDTPVQAVFNVVLALILLGTLIWISLSRLGLQLDFSVLTRFRTRIWQGFVTTMGLSLASLVFSLLLGFLAALGNQSRFLPFSYLSKVYVQFIRGTPLIMQIYLFYYIMGTAWGVENRFWAGIIILSVFEGAYISEIIRGGLQSIDSTQLEAAEACGLDRSQTMRLVILPQLVNRTLPALAGQFASIIKDSSLLSIIAVIELTQAMREISATNFALFECYIFLGLLYLLLTMPLSLLTQRLEKRYRYET